MLIIVLTGFATFSLSVRNQSDVGLRQCHTHQPQLPIKRKDVSRETFAAVLAYLLRIKHTITQYSTSIRKSDDFVSFFLTRISLHMQTIGQIETNIRHPSADFIL